MQEHPLRHYRRLHGFSLEVFAKRVGTSKATLCRIETGTNGPSHALLQRLIEATEGAVTADMIVAFRAPQEAA